MFNKLIKSPLLFAGARYGAIGAVLCMVFLVSLYFMNRNPFLINPFLDPRIPVYVVMLLFMLKEVRDFYFQGTLYFWQGMIGAMIFTLVCACLCWVLIMGFAAIQPDLVDNFIVQALEQTRSFSTENINRIGKETFDQSLLELKRTDRYFLAGRYFFQSFIISFFISIIISVILRRQPQN